MASTYNRRGAGIGYDSTVCHRGAVAVAAQEADGRTMGGFESEMEEVGSLCAGEGQRG